MWQSQYFVEKFRKNSTSLRRRMAPFTQNAGLGFDEP
jgi:hypothetical protein